MRGPTFFANLKMHFVNRLSLLLYLVIILFVKINIVALVHRKLDLVVAQQNLVTEIRSRFHISPTSKKS